MSLITPELLIAAYAAGYFPMAESRHDHELHWFQPELRGIIPLDQFHTPRSLARLMRKQPFAITVDTAFKQVIEGCAQREETWINDEIIRLYCALRERNFAHSVECWQDGRLVGGIYGVAIGGAFFAESMFSHVPNASRIALTHLVRLLKDAGYVLFDTQYSNDHLLQFGVVDLPQEDYMRLLDNALTVTPQAI